MVTPSNPSEHIARKEGESCRRDRAAIILRHLRPKWPWPRSRAKRPLRSWPRGSMFIRIRSRNGNPSCSSAPRPCLQAPVRLRSRDRISRRCTPRSGSCRVTVRPTHLDGAVSCRFEFSDSSASAASDAAATPRCGWTAASVAARGCP